MIGRGDRIEVAARGPAHGGAMIASVLGAQAPNATVFLRHALPQETGIAIVRSVRKGGGLVFADLVEVQRASPDRVRPPCRYSGPDSCGGCDFQHVSVAAQRRLKADVIADSLTRIGRLDAAQTGWDGLVHPVPGDEDGLRWRTRSRFAVLGNGLAMHKWRSAEVVPIDDCLIVAAPVVGAAREAIAADPQPPAEVAAVVSSLGDTRAASPAALDRQRVREQVGQRVLQLSAGGFWQVHPGASEALAQAVAQVLQLRPGQRLLDLYAGAGMFAAALADAQPASIEVVEGDARAAAAARDNLRDVPGCRVTRADVGTWLSGYRGRADAVVLDPPRTGAGPQVLGELDRVGAGRVAYVACDPASLARDLRTAADLGWSIDSLVAFDLFPMTHHVECVAGLRPRT